MTIDRHIGVIGAGSFGTAIANLIALNSKVILLANSEESANQIKANGSSAGQDLHSNITVTHLTEKLCNDCELIFPIVPSQDFFAAMEKLAPMLHSEHILIHGTKGLHVLGNTETVVNENVLTMSQVITHVTKVHKIGCLAGPNLAREIAEGKPAATVIASNSSEVLELGQLVLRSSRFQVLWNDDLHGVELCGIIKNIIAIASGALSGFELGENAKALLVNRGMVEMIHIGRNLGAGTKAFLGIAGMGDLMATCNSPKSRNFNVGIRLSKGESPKEIMQNLEETAEGINTTRIIYSLSEQNGWKTPITKLVYKVLFEEFPIDKAVETLMKLPVREDIDFI